MIGFLNSHGTSPNLFGSAPLDFEAMTGHGESYSRSHRKIVYEGTTFGNGDFDTTFDFDELHFGGLDDETNLDDEDPIEGENDRIYWAYMDQYDNDIDDEADRFVPHFSGTIYRRKVRSGYNEDAKHGWQRSKAHTAPRGWKRFSPPKNHGRISIRYMADETRLH